MAYLGSETREQPASSKSTRALIMLTGTSGPGGGAVWDVTPARPGGRLPATGL